MKKIKFIFFDLGGVLVDHIGALRKIARQLNITEEDTISLFKKNADDLDRGTLPWQDFEIVFYNKLQPSQHLKHRLIESFVDNFNPILETHNFINKIDKYIDMGILSNVSKDVFQLITKNKLIPNIHYKAEIISGEIGLIKPYKEIYEYAAKKINILPSEILLVDDKVINLETAKVLGWNSVLFNTSNPSESILRIENQYFLS